MKKKQIEDDKYKSPIPQLDIYKEKAENVEKGKEEKEEKDKEGKYKEEKYKAEKEGKQKKYDEKGELIEDDENIDVILFNEMQQEDKDADSELLEFKDKEKEEIYKSLSKDQASAKLLEAESEKIGGVFNNLDISKIKNQAFNEVLMDLPTISDYKHSEESTTYSETLSLKDRCREFKNEMLNTHEIKVRPDSIYLLNKCSDNMYNEVVKKGISGSEY